MFIRLSSMCQCPYMHTVRQQQVPLSRQMFGLMPCWLCRFKYLKHMQAMPNKLQPMHCWIKYQCNSMYTMHNTIVPLQRHMLHNMSQHDIFVKRFVFTMWEQLPHMQDCHSLPHLCLSIHLLQKPMLVVMCSRIRRYKLSMHSTSNLHSSHLQHQMLLTMSNRNIPWN